MEPLWYTGGLGLVAIILMCVSAFLIVRKNGLKHELTMSQHAALNEQTFLQFAIVSTIANVLFFLFVNEWMIPYYGLPKLFFYTFILGMTCQLAAAWVPTKGDNLFSRVHDFFAYTMAYLMPILLLQLVIAPTVPLAGRTVALIGATLEILLILFFWTKRQWVGRRFFILQSTYIVLFYISMLSVAYLS